MLAHCSFVARSLLVAELRIPQARAGSTTSQQAQPGQRRQRSNMSVASTRGSVGQQHQRWSAPTSVRPERRAQQRWACSFLVAHVKLALRKRGARSEAQRLSWIGFYSLPPPLTRDRAPCAVARRAPCVSCASRVRARARGFKLTACGSPAHPPAKPAHPPRRVLRGLRIVRWTSPLIVVRGRVARPAQGRKITEFLFVAMGPFGFYRTDALRSLLAQCSLIAGSLLVHCSAIARSLLVHCSWRAVV